MFRFYIICGILFAAAVLVRPLAGRQTVFPDTDQARIVAYWATAGRYSVAIPEANRHQPWQVRLTADGSVWLMKYQQAIGAAKLPPTVDVTAQPAASAQWREWVRRKVASDRWNAQRVADGLNVAAAASGGLPDRRAAELPSRGRTASRLAAGTAQDVAPVPGPIPADLLAALGNPPDLAAAVTPLQHMVHFDEGDTYILEDHRNVPPTYGYYRFPQGVGAAGTPLDDGERAALFEAAGLSPTQQRVMTAVSRLEGSFDAVNTYDTGYVSVGFLQFITHEDGRHSLADVLYHEKVDAPSAFDRDFQRFGIGLTPDRLLAVVDPNTGAELTGPDAVRKVVDDKRLIAVFQKAGRTSTEFRVAQIRVAKENYWPDADPVAVEIDGKVLSGKVSDVIKSEAGLATFFDRKVNRGSVNPLAETLAATMRAHGLKRISDAARYEREIVAACKYRADYLADPGLGQPQR